MAAQLTTNSEETKQSIRVKVWDYIEKENLANFPRPVHNRIPNFKGADEAGIAVTKLPEFSLARTIKVNPDKPQEEVRYQALARYKNLIVPTPRLKSGLFNRLTNCGDPTKQQLRILASRQGIDTLSKPVDIETKLEIDMVVIGSVAVDKLGHRIGKGEGFADLEFALAASHHKAVDQDTVVVTTVHDCQVFDFFSEHLFTDYDVPVDIIVTATEVIRVENKLRKPVKIIWNLLTEEKLRQVKLLQTIRLAEKNSGIDVTLGKNTKLHIETKNKNIRNESHIPQVKRTEQHVTQNHGLYFSNIPKDVRVSDFKEAVRSTGAKLVFVRWKPFKHAAVVFFEGKYEEILKQFEKFEINETQLKVEELKSKEQTNDAACNTNQNLKRQSREKKKISRPSFEDKSGLFFGRIPRTTKKADLLSVLEERDAKPIHIEWNGRKGYASAFWNENVQVILEKLKDLSLIGSKINIENYNKLLVKKKLNVDNEIEVVYNITEETEKETKDNENVTQKTQHIIKERDDNITKQEEIFNHKEDIFIMKAEESGVIKEKDEEEIHSSIIKIKNEEVETQSAENEINIAITKEMLQLPVVEEKITENNDQIEILKVYDTNAKTMCLEEEKASGKAEEKNQLSIVDQKIEIIHIRLEEAKNSILDEENGGNNVSNGEKCMNKRKDSVRNIEHRSEISMVHAETKEDRATEKRKQFLVKEDQNKKAENKIDFENNHEHRSDVMPAVICCDMIRDIQGSKTDVVNFEDNLSFDESCKIIEKIPNINNFVVSSISKLSLSANSSQHYKAVQEDNQQKPNVKSEYVQKEIIKTEDCNEEKNKTEFKVDNERINGILEKEKDHKSRSRRDDSLKTVNSKGKSMTRVEKRPESKLSSVSMSSHDESKNEKNSFPLKHKVERNVKKDITDKKNSDEMKIQKTNFDTVNSSTKQTLMQSNLIYKSETKHDKNLKEAKQSKTGQADTEKHMKISSNRNMEMHAIKKRAKSSARPDEKAFKSETKSFPSDPSMSSKAKPSQYTKNSHDREKSVNKQNTTSVRLTDAQQTYNQESPETKSPSKSIENNVPKTSHDNTPRNENLDKNKRSKSNHKPNNSEESKSPSKGDIPGNKSDKDNCIIC